MYHQKDVTSAPCDESQQIMQLNTDIRRGTACRETLNHRDGVQGSWKKAEKTSSK
jgi:hypothetical protein